MTIGSRSSNSTARVRPERPVASHHASGVPAARITAIVMTVVRALSAKAAAKRGWRRPANRSAGEVAAISASTGSASRHSIGAAIRNDAAPAPVADGVR